MVIDMKKLLAIIQAAILIFSMTACQSSDQISCPADGEPEKVNAPGSNGASKPTSTEPPELKVLDSTCIGIVANKGTYSWTYDNGDGTQTGVCADSSHPLEWQEFLVPMTTSDDTVELYFDVQPQEISVRCWSDEYWGKVDAEEENVTLIENSLKVKDGGYIYEVVARWTGENLAAEGTVHYGFYIGVHAQDLEFENNGYMAAAGRRICRCLDSYFSMFCKFYRKDKKFGTIAPHTS